MKTEARGQQPMVRSTVPGHWVCYPVDRRERRLPHRPGRPAGTYDCVHVRADSLEQAKQRGARDLRFMGFRFHAVDAVPFSGIFRQAADGTLQFLVR